MEIKKKSNVIPILVAIFMVWLATIAMITPKDEPVTEPELKAPVVQSTPEQDETLAKKLFKGYMISTCDDEPTPEEVASCKKLYPCVIDKMYLTNTAEQTKIKIGGADEEFTNHFFKCVEELN